jgi:hypothetical protein
MFQSTVQIAGVKDLAEAQLLENLGVDFIGFPLRLGYHKPDTSEDMARTIIAGMKAPQRAVLTLLIWKRGEARLNAPNVGSTGQGQGGVALFRWACCRWFKGERAVVPSDQ